MDILSITQPTELPVDGLSRFLEFLLSSRFQQIIFPIKIVFILFSIILAAGILYFAIYTDYLYYLWFEDFDELLKWRKKYKIKKKRKMFKNIVSKIVGPRKKKGKIELERAKEKINRGREIDYKLAILDIDRLLNKELEKRGIKGMNLSEKLENIKHKTLKNLEDLRKDRTIVNEIKKKKKREIKKEEAEQIIEIYKKALSQLRAI